MHRSLHLQKELTKERKVEHVFITETQIIEVFRNCEAIGIHWLGVKNCLKLCEQIIEM